MAYTDDKSISVLVLKWIDLKFLFAWNLFYPLLVQLLLSCLKLSRFRPWMHWPSCAWVDDSRTPTVRSDIPPWLGFSRTGLITLISFLDMTLQMRVLWDSSYCSVISWLLHLLAPGIHIRLYKLSPLLVEFKRDQLTGIRILIITRRICRRNQFKCIPAFGWEFVNFDKEQIFHAIGCQYNRRNVWGQSLAKRYNRSESSCKICLSPNKISEACRFGLVCLNSS